MNTSRNSRYPVSTRRINKAGKVIGGHNRAEHGDTYIETNPKRSRKIARQRLTNAVNHQHPI